MHSLPSARVHELRGQTKLRLLEESESIALVTLAASISAEESLLDILLVKFIDYCETRKKGQKTYKSLHHYFCTILNDEIQFRTIDQLVLISTNYMYILTYCFIRQMKEH